MPHFIDDEELDRQLREAAPYIDDNGFTAKLLQSLPAPQVSAPARLRGVILIVATLVATLLTYVLSGRGRFVEELLLQLFALPTTWLLGLACAAGIVVGALGLAAAVFKAREPALLIR
jgi:hypothetical protein